MKKWLIILMMLPCFALAEDISFTFVTNNTGAIITDCTLPDGVVESLVLPSESHIGVPVVRIADGALAHEYIIRRVEIPATIEDIPEGTFGYGTEIILHPDNPCFTNTDGFLIDVRTNTLLHTSPSAAEKPLPAVTRLGNECLKNWHAEGHITLPDTLTSIGIAVFHDCVDVTGITIPDGVTEIGAYAFNCTSLTEIQLPPGLTSIPHLMLSCNYISEITIPESVKYIGEWAFYLCPLTRVEIPAGCEFVEYKAFDPEVELVLLGNNTHLETLEEYAVRTGQDWLLENQEDTFTSGMWEYRVVEDSAILTNWNHNTYGDAVPEVVTLPSELGGQPVVGIANNALNTYEMYYEHSFTLVIPEGVKWLSDDVFWCCHNADAIYFPASLTEIPEGCFDHVYAEFIVAEGNPRYEMRDGFLIDKQEDAIVYTTPECRDKPIPAVRRIGSSSMENWGTEWGQNVVIPEGVEEIGSFAFYDWELGHVALPESLRVIETEAFCVVITEPVVIPASVELIQRGAFFYDETSVIVTSDATHFETAGEYDARVGYLWWGDEE